LSFALAAGCAVAQAAPSGAQPNREARRADMQAKADARFNSSDSNHDGKLSLTEMQSAAQAKIAERFAKLDANHDGGVSQEEMRQSRRQHGEMFRQHREAMGANR
jgi:Ca2+-binding EF-hand superfamily protein